MNSSYIVKMLAEISTIMNENKDRLIELDSVVGDGDLGLTMTKGFAAASEFAAGSDEADAGKMLYGAGKAMCGAIYYGYADVYWTYAGRKGSEG